MDRNELSSQVKIGVIIVTHNSNASLGQTLESLKKQTYPITQVMIVDSGSTDTRYLKEHDHASIQSNQDYLLEMCFMSNIGFSFGNNLGYSALDKSIEYVLFLNPDIVLPEQFLENAVNWLKNCKESVGAISGPLYGWDLEKKEPTTFIDSTGIFSTWYGKWYDRARGQSSLYNRYQKIESVPALCGALMLAPKASLEAVKMAQNAIFDPSFFCYKEDIDLSLRLKKAGYSLFYVPNLIAYHARGWNEDRSKMSKTVRLMSAENELKLHMKLKNPIKICYSLCKYIGVKVFNL